MKFESVDLPDIDLFNYCDYRAFLNSLYIELKSKDSKYSIRYLSNRFGLKSSGALGMILKGGRNPSYELGLSICKALGFNKTETKYFQALVKVSKENVSDVDKISLKKDLLKINPKAEIYELETTTFDMISNWYFFAIRQLSYSSKFNDDVDWIFKKLRKKVSKNNIKNALDILEKNKLLKRVEGKLVGSNEQVETTTDVPSEAIRLHHEQMIEMAKSSIREIDLAYRDIAGTTFNVDPSQLSDMKKELNDFRKYFYKKYESKKANATYQINMQLFPLSDF